MKRIIALFLIVAMMLTLAACGKKEEAASENGDNIQNTPGAGEAPAENGAEFNEAGSDALKRVSDIVITGMKLNKETYTAGEEIVLTLTWSGTPAPTTWVGIIPAEVPHGDEYVNDENDLDYIYLDGHEGNEFVFSIELEPGEYTLRVNETDDGGAELAFCSFIVE